jgi:hypothetical protein
MKRPPINALDRARRYLATLPPAVSGQGGHHAAFRAALALAKGFDLAFPEALATLRAWNETCVPPWSEAELSHKLRDAYDRPGPAGYLLEKSGARRAFVSRAAQVEQAAAQAAREAAEAAERAAKRAAWPEFRQPTAAQVEEIARARRVGVSAVQALAAWRMLSVATARRSACWMVHNRLNTFAQARRLDGEPFTLADGERVKSWNLPGSVGGWLQLGLENTTAPVLLVEGCAGLLEALHCVQRHHATTGQAWAALAATSAGSRFASPEARALLAKLWRRRVVIVADADAAGENAANHWLYALNHERPASLRGEAPPAVAIAPPSGSKDLGDVLRRPDAEALIHQLLS